MPQWRYNFAPHVVDSILFNTHNCNAKEGSVCSGFADEVDTAQVTET